MITDSSAYKQKKQMATDVVNDIYLYAYASIRLNPIFSLGKT